jgi:hypothetical protein
VVEWKNRVLEAGFTAITFKMKHRLLGEHPTMRSPAATIEIPLFRVWGEHRDLRWPKLLDFWGLPNLQVISWDVHITKSADEAAYRRFTRSLSLELE